MNYRRIGAVLLAALCTITCAQTSQQPPQPSPEIKISIASTKDPNLYAVTLRNLSQHGLTVVLGDICDGQISTVTYKLKNEISVDLSFISMGMPCGGNFGPLTADLAPSGCYTYDMHLDETGLGWDQALLRAASAGEEFYRLQALIDGEEGIREWNGFNIKRFGKYPVWRGHAASAWIPFPSPNSPDWRGYAQRGGSVRTAPTPACASTHN